MFFELRLMINSTLCCMKSLFWSLILLFLVMYIFGVYFTQVAAEHKEKHCGDAGASQQHCQDLETYFGSIVLTLYSMFQAISGGADWSDIANPLAKINPGSGFIFCFYICFTVFALM